MGNVLSIRLAGSGLGGGSSKSTLRWDASLAESLGVASLSVEAEREHPTAVATRRGGSDMLRSCGAPDRSGEVPGRV